MTDPGTTMRKEVLASIRRIRERMKKRDALQQADREAEADLISILNRLSDTGAPQ